MVDFDTVGIDFEHRVQSRREPCVKALRVRRTSRELRTESAYIFRRRRAHDEWRARERVLEPELERVEERAPSTARLLLVPVRIPVERITEHRATEAGHVNTDLMGTAGVDAHRDE